MPASAAFSDAMLMVIGMADPELALYTTPVQPDGSGSEVVGGGYARQAVTLSLPDGSGAVTNDAVVSFSNMPAVTVTHWAIWINSPDNPSERIISAYGELSTPATFLGGESPDVPIGALEVTVL